MLLPLSDLVHPSFVEHGPGVYTPATCCKAPWLIKVQLPCLLPGTHLQLSEPRQFYEWPIVDPEGSGCGGSMMKLSKYPHNRSFIVWFVVGKFISHSVMIKCKMHREAIKPCVGCYADIWNSFEQPCIMGGICLLWKDGQLPWALAGSNSINPATTSWWCIAFCCYSESGESSSRQEVKYLWVSLSCQL